MGKITKKEVAIQGPSLKGDLTNLKPILDLKSSQCNNCYFDAFTPEDTQVLQLDTVIDLIQNYKDHQHTFIQNSAAAGTPQLSNDARSVWFSLNRLKTFIYEIENQCCPCSGKLGKLGIRFYYGAYPSSLVGTEHETHVPAQYANMHTLVMIPTYTNAKGDNVDFDPDAMEGCSPISLDEMGGGNNYLNTATKRAPLKKKSKSKSKSVKVLVGGFSNEHLKKTETAATKGVATFMNKGGLIPPPSLVEPTKYPDATLLNLCR
jgi:hypothetical protein